VRSNRAATEAYAEQILALVAPEPAGPRKVAGTFVAGCTHFFRGRFEQARVTLERCIDDYAPEHHPELSQAYGDDPGLFCYQYLAWLYVILGDTKTALDHVDKMHALAARFGDPLSMATSHVWSAIVFHELRDVERAGEHASRAVEISDAHGFPLWQALSMNARGWAKAMRGNLEGGLAEIEAGLGIVKAINLKLPLAYWLGYRIDVLRLAGRYQEALDTIDEALAYSNENVDSFNEFELLRLRAVTLRDRDAADPSVLAGFERALDSAREFRAVHYEVRVAASAAPSLIAAGRSAQAQEWLEAALSRVPAGAALDYTEARLILVRLKDEVVDPRVVRVAGEA